jgi:hypothetical protein
MPVSTHVYEVRPRKDHRGVDLISDVLPFGRLWYGEPDAVSNAIDYAKFFSRSPPISLKPAPPLLVKTVELPAVALLVKNILPRYSIEYCVLRTRRNDSRRFVIESLTRSDETNTFSSRNRCPDLADGCAAQRGQSSAV